MVRYVPAPVIQPKVRSSAVREAFSWNTPIDPVVVARQVNEALVFSVPKRLLMSVTAMEFFYRKCLFQAPFTYYYIHLPRFP